MLEHYQRYFLICCPVLMIWHWMSLIANWETNPLWLKYYNYIFSQLNVHIKFFEHHNKVIFSVSQIIANCQVCSYFQSTPATKQQPQKSSVFRSFLIDFGNIAHRKLPTMKQQKSVQASLDKVIIHLGWLMYYLFLRNHVTNFLIPSTLLWPEIWQSSI